MLIALALLAAAPSPQAVALGERLARTGTLAALLPLTAGREADEMVAAHPGLTPGEQATLRRIARDTALGAADRLFAAEGRAYAGSLSLADLRALVARAEAPVARRQRAAMPAAIAAAAAALAGFDLKAETLAAFCAATGKGCPPAK